MTEATRTTLEVVATVLGLAAVTAGIILVIVIAVRLWSDR